MADSEDQEQKTEAPSAKRIKQAWDDGQIPMGRDVLALAAFAAATLVFQRVGPAFRDSTAQLVGDAMRGAATPDFAALPGRMVRPALMLLSGSAAAAALALVAGLAQTRGQVWAELAMPDFSRLWQNRVGKLVTAEFWVDLALALVKVVAVGWACYSALRGDFLTLGGLLSVSPASQLSSLFGSLASASVKVVGALALIAAADMAVQHLRFNKKMRMTKEEAKREHKEEEGDPLIRSRRRRKHRQLAKARVRQEVPKADAIVVNPTHIAIAIRYRKDEGKAPRVTAKGKGQLAEIMRDLARENGIPIVQDIPLARLLYKKVKVGREVPAETYKAVAAVLAFVYRVTRRSAGARS